MVKTKLKVGYYLLAPSVQSSAGNFRHTRLLRSLLLNGLMHSLAIVLGKYGILVNSLLPGTIMTDINKEDLSNLEKESIWKIGLQ